MKGKSTLLCQDVWVNHEIRNEIKKSHPRWKFKESWLTAAASFIFDKCTHMSMNKLR
jgi:hypothetical protein